MNYSILFCDRLTVIIARRWSLEIALFGDPGAAPNRRAAATPRPILVGNSITRNRNNAKLSLKREHANCFLLCKMEIVFAQKYFWPQ